MEKKEDPFLLSPFVCCRPNISQNSRHLCISFFGEPINSITTLWYFLNRLSKMSWITLYSLLGHHAFKWH